MRTVIPILIGQILLGQGQNLSKAPVFPQSLAHIGPDDEMHLADLPLANFHLGDREYSLDRKGILSCRNAKGTRINFRLRVPKGYYVTGIQAFEDSNLVYVLSSISDWDSGGAVIQAFNRSTGACKWSKQFNAFNIGQSVVVDSSWIISGIGAIAKIELNSGKFLWIHSNLYNQRTGAFNSFETPIFEGGRILFTEHVSSSSPRASNPCRVVIDFTSGRILENSGQ